MITRSPMRLYLPRRTGYHVKIILASLLIAVFFNIIWGGDFFSVNFWLGLVSVMLQLYIFMYLSVKFFPATDKKTGKDYRNRIIFRLITFYLIVAGISMIFSFLLNWILIRHFSAGMEHFLSHGLQPFFLSWIIGVGIASVIFFYIEWTKGLQREQKLREEKLIFQYETLKNQVNPHFLFNSLNTLSSLAVKDPQLMEEYIGKFSGIYRYILENKDRDWVSLSEEISFVQNYFFLQEVRDAGKIRIVISIEDPRAFRILPISLQVLVENAFKHNAATRESPLSIRIYLEDPDMLVVENNLQRKMTFESSSHTGLKNLQERVALVMKREVVVMEDSEKFIVKVPVLRQ